MTVICWGPARTDFRERTPGEAYRHLQRLAHLAPFSDPKATGSVDEALSLGERVFVHVKDRSRGSRHILFCMSDTGGCNAVLPLLDAAMQDPRVRAVSLNITCAALRKFQGNPYRERFTELDSNAPLMYRRLLLSDPYALEVPLTDVVVTYATYAGLEDNWLMNAKSTFKASRLVYVQDNWAQFKGFNRIRNLDRDPVDCILCNDDWSKAAITSGWNSGDGPPPKVMATGTGVVVAHDQGEATHFRDSGRKKLGLLIGEIGTLFVGSYEKNYPQLSVHVLCQFLDQLVSNSESSHVILVRPHPSDSNAEELRAVCERRSGRNVRIVWADSSVVTMDEVGYAADRVVGVDSTEVVTAALRGKPAAFVFNPAAAGAQRFAGYYPSIEASEGKIGVIGSSAAMKTFLGSTTRAALVSPSTNSSDKIGARMLAATLG